MLKQRVKHFKNMSVKISYYIFSSLNKLLQLASDALEIWGRKYVQVILTLTSCLQICKDKIILWPLCICDVRDLLFQMQTIFTYQNLMRYENVLTLHYSVMCFST